VSALQFSIYRQGRLWTAWAELGDPMPYLESADGDVPGLMSTHWPSYLQQITNLILDPHIHH
jgi:hypothetical protein